MRLRRAARTARSPSIHKILLAITTGLTLLIVLLCARDLTADFARLTRIGELRDASALSDRLFVATNQLSVERDLAMSMLHAGDDDTRADLQLLLVEARTASDQAFAAAAATLDRDPLPNLADLRARVEAGHAAIGELRPLVDREASLPAEARDAMLPAIWYDAATQVMADTEGLWLDFIGPFTTVDPVVTQHLRLKQMLRTLTDYTGRERSVIGQLLSENAAPTIEQTALLLRGEGVLQQGWATSRLLAVHSGLYPSIASAYSDAESHYETMRGMTQGMFYAPGAALEGGYPIGPDLWFELSSQAAESLEALRRAVRASTDAYLEEMIDRIRRSIAVQVAILLAALAICGYSFRVIVVQVIRPINAIVDALVVAMRGEPVSFSPPARTDNEIGKLSAVLDAFQAQAVEVQRQASELLRRTGALEQTNKELDDFAYIASHDLKEPLRGMSNHSRFLLEDNAGKLDEDSERRLNRLIALSQRMERLVDDLLGFSRLGRAELTTRPTDLGAVVADIEDTLEHFLEERGARIEIAGALPTLVCDPTRVTELLRNLIVNAVKYNDRPEKLVEVGVLASARSRRGALLRDVVYVKDDGRGIDPQFHDDVFRIFRRLQSDGDGGGVGLTFAKKIVDRHGGEIWIDSKVGEGATFFFTLQPASAQSKERSAA